MILIGIYQQPVIQLLVMMTMEIVDLQILLKAKKIGTEIMLIAILFLIIQR